MTYQKALEICINRIEDRGFFVQETQRLKSLAIQIINFLLKEKLIILDGKE